MCSFRGRNDAGLLGNAEKFVRFVVDLSESSRFNLKDFPDELRLSNIERLVNGISFGSV